MLETIGKDPRFKPVALVDEHTTTAKTAQYRLTHEAGHKNVPIFSGLTGAIAQLEADALIVSTPTRTHADLIRMALVVNQHVLVDKAMTHDYPDAKALVGEADTAWVKLCVAQDQRARSARQEWCASLYLHYRDSRRRRASTMHCSS